MGNKESDCVRILDKCDNSSLSEDQRSSEPVSSETTKKEKTHKKIIVTSPKQPKIDHEKLAKSLGALYHHPVNEAVREVDMGLDISSSITGVVLLDKAGGMIFMGHVPLTSAKYKNIFNKADAVIEWMKQTLPRSVKVSRIFVEANAKRFAPGFSSADTILTLAKMNALVSYLAYKWYGVEIVDVHVTSARSKIGYKNVKAIKKPVKEKVREFVLLNNPELPFQTRVVTVGKHKGETVPAAGCADEIDAFVICRGGQLIQSLPDIK